MTITERQKTEVLREALQSLHNKQASELPEVAYDHNGPHWAEWLKNVLAMTIGKVVTRDDIRFVQGLLRADIRAHMLRHQMPTPELRATMMVWTYGVEQALGAFVEPAWAAGEFPDENITWLLLHPERIPANFPMYQVAR